MPAPMVITKSEDSARSDAGAGEFLPASELNEWDTGESQNGIEL